MVKAFSLDRRKCDGGDPMLALRPFFSEEPEAQESELLHEAGVSKGEEGCLEEEKNEGRSGIQIESENE